MLGAMGKNSSAQSKRTGAALCNSAVCRNRSVHRTVSTQVRFGSAHLPKKAAWAQGIRGQGARAALGAEQWRNLPEIM